MLILGADIMVAARARILWSKGSIPMIVFFSRLAWLKDKMVYSWAPGPGCCHVESFWPGVGAWSELGGGAFNG
jgi:hypothetical protein